MTEAQVIEKILNYINLHRDAKTYSQDKNAALHPDILQAA